MLDECVISPGVAVNCDFKMPSRFNDEILINVSLKEYTGVKYVFEYVMTNKQTNDLILVGKTKHCFIDKTLWNDENKIIKQVKTTTTERLCTCVCVCVYIHVCTLWEGLVKNLSA